MCLKILKIFTLKLHFTQVFIENARILCHVWKPMWHLHRTIHESILKNVIHAICYYLWIYYLLPNLSTKCLKMIKSGKASLYHNWSLGCHKIYGLYIHTTKHKWKQGFIWPSYSEPSQTSKIDIFPKSSISDVWQSFGCTSDIPVHEYWEMWVFECPYDCAVQVCLCI